MNNGIFPIYLEVAQFYHVFAPAICLAVLYCTISIHHGLEMCVDFRGDGTFLPNHVESLGATHIGVLLLRRRIDL